VAKHLNESQPCAIIAHQ